MASNRFELASDIFPKLTRKMSREDATVGAKAFYSLSTNRERVDFVLELLRKYRLISDLIEDRKNDQEADEVRKEANDFFKKKMDVEALAGYTKSLTLAQPGGEKLALAFANRSAVLFEKKFFRECLNDISNALSTGKYPENLTEKLMERKRKAEIFVANQLIIDRHEKIPVISAKNPMIECASDAVAIASDESCGRYLTARRRIRVGEVIAVEEPFAKILNREHYLSRCYHCLKDSYNLIPCDNCTCALFCSRICKEESLESYHRVECPILKTLFEMKIDKMAMIDIRVSIQSLKCIESNQSVDDTLYRSKNYYEIHNLSANTHLRSPSDLMERSAIAALIYVFLEKCNDFTDSSKMTLKENLLRYMQIGPTNFHEISALVGGKDKQFELEEIGAGAYSFLSLLNHSCCPNVIRHCYEDRIVLRALRPIAENQQLFDNYGYHYAVMAKEIRREQLRSQYYFDCNCEACIQNWLSYRELPRKGLETGVTEEQFDSLRAGDLKTAKEVSEKLIDKAEEFDRSHPCQDLCEIQEMLKQCFAIFGNKRILL